jgi:pheromone shutdown protein TraB
MDKLFTWARPVLNYLKPWLLSFLVGLVIAVGQAITAYINAEPFNLSNFAGVIFGAVAAYVGLKFKHIQVKDLQAIVDGLLEALNGQQLPAQEPISTSVQAELDKG